MLLLSFDLYFSCALTSKTQLQLITYFSVLVKVVAFGLAYDRYKDSNLSFSALIGQNDQSVNICNYSIQFRHLKLAL